MARKARISAAVLAVLHGGERHAWTLDELQEDLTRQGLDCDFSSLFRATEKLVADGSIRKINVDDGRARLELGGGHHDHLYCVQCSRIIAIPCVIARGDIDALERQAGVAVTDHHLVVNGICRDCRGLVEAVDGGP